MVTGEINIISQPGQQLWPGLAWARLDILAGRIRPGQIFKIQPGQVAWPGRPPGACQAPGQAGSSGVYIISSFFFQFSLMKFHYQKRLLGLTIER